MMGTLANIGLVVIASMSGLGTLSIAAHPVNAPQTDQQKFDNKSDTAKGVDQLKAQTQGRPYANPGRQKALDEAMNDGSSSPTPKPRPTGSASPQATPR
ncbi:hypothetical protein [Sphingomonas oligophenolica]|uniref:hypothetical protein n=1 Tax=Sphingomonas oligophenolica TaxID=301154 RepID=UPI0011298386|nr:hypothetical protein [Sphingomonas oligophenolica]